MFKIGDHVKFSGCGKYADSCLIHRSCGAQTEEVLERGFATGVVVGNAGNCFTVELDRDNSARFSVLGEKLSIFRANKTKDQAKRMLNLTKE